MCWLPFPQSRQTVFRTCALDGTRHRPVLHRDDLPEWIFYTDIHTFRERYALIKDRGLQGLCAWVLGTEDPAIRDLLPSHK